jgi:hypothetical protein
MEHTSAYFLAIAAGLASFALHIVWSRQETPMRGMAVVMLIVWLPILAFMATDVLGWHKPIWAAHRLVGKQRVLGHKMVRGEAIYLYLDVGPGEPRAIRVPWNDNTASRLQKALRESRKRGRRGAIMKFDHSWDTHGPQFHPLPQPRTPIPKRQRSAPRYERGA